MKSDLDLWCTLCGYVPALHHRLINQKLTALAKGTGKSKVALFLPPGSAKSTYASQLFPPWYLSLFPRHSVLAASHSMDLAERWGRRCRNLIEEHQATLGISLSQGNRAAGRWQLAGDPTLMGEYLAAGSNTQIAGFRADLGIIDDPVAGREDVLSDTQRNKLWDWYVYDYRPRLKPDAKQLLIMTRWHLDDLAGRILAEEGDEWEIVSIPMIAEDLNDPLGREIGQRLWSGWFTEKMVEVAQRDPILWNSLYQQRPSVEGGAYWKRDWLHPVPPDQVPPRKHLRLYGASDYAVTVKITADYTVHGVIGLDPQDRPWIVDLWRARTSSDVWVNEFCELVKWWKPLSWAEEQGQIISGVGPWIEREQHKQKAFTERLQFVSRQDKGVRAQSMRGLVATKGLWYAEDLPYRAEMEAELVAFPAGKHDDIHDMLGLAGQLLDIAIHGRVEEKPKTEAKSGYRTVGQSGAHQGGVAGVL